MHHHGTLCTLCFPGIPDSLSSLCVQSILDTLAF